VSRPAIHIIGAGLAGLAAAIDLASTDARIILHDSAKAAGGRCRSYFDRRLRMEIDNGNHLMLSCNADALAYVRAIKAEDRLTCFPDARFTFIDFASGARSTLSPWPGPLPLWRLMRDRHAQRAGAGDYAGVLKLMLSRGDRPLREIMRCEGPLYDGLLRPLLLAALNTDPAQASSALARGLLRETLLKGGKACRPIMVRGGLSSALIDPALRLLEAHKAELRFVHRLQALHLTDSHVDALQFDDETIPLLPDDLVILATPASVAAALAPWIKAPTSFNAIVNVHFAITPPTDLTPVTAITGAMTEWLFAYADRLSVTISAANDLLTRDHEDLARRIWREVSSIAGVSGELPPWRIVKERRATFAATPEQNKRRPTTRSACDNLLLAGDWTDTGLPATIEGAIKSGYAAAREARLLLMRDHNAPPDPLRQRKTFAHADHG